MRVARCGSSLLEDSVVEIRPYFHKAECLKNIGTYKDTNKRASSRISSFSLFAPMIELLSPNFLIRRRSKYEIHRFRTDTLVKCWSGLRVRWEKKNTSSTRYCNMMTSNFLT